MSIFLRKWAATLTLAAFAAVIFLCSGFAPARAATAAEQACPPYSRAVKVKFNTLMPPLIYNHRLDVAGIRNLFLTRGQTVAAVHERALGVTYSEIVFYIEGNTVIVPRGRGYCVYLETVEAEFGWKRMEVHIAGEFARGTCEYNAVLDHENQHVAIIKTALSEYAPRVRAELERELRRQAPIFTRDLQTAADRSVEDLYGRMQGVVDRFQRAQAGRHGAIDSSRNYGAIADLCPNWNKNLTASRQQR